MKPLFVTVLFCVSIQAFQGQDSPHSTPLPFDLPVFIQPMPYGFDAAIRRELQTNNVFKVIATGQGDAGLLIRMVENSVAFALPDGSPYGNWTIPLNAEALGDIRKGKTKKWAQQVAYVIKKSVEPMLFRSERDLLAQCGRPYTLVPGTSGGKTLVWLDDLCSINPTYGTEPKCGMTVPVPAENIPALPIHCDKLYGDAGHFKGIAYDVNDKGLIYNIRHVVF